jgi:hypothetical protein
MGNEQSNEQSGSQETIQHQNVLEQLQQQQQQNTDDSSYEPQQQGGRQKRQQVLKKKLQLEDEEYQKQLIETKAKKNSIIRRKVEAVSELQREQIQQEEQQRNEFRKRMQEELQQKHEELENKRIHIEQQLREKVRQQLLESDDLDQKSDIQPVKPVVTGIVPVKSKEQIEKEKKKKRQQKILAKRKVEEQLRLAELERIKKEDELAQRQIKEKEAQWKLEQRRLERRIEEQERRLNENDDSESEIDEVEMNEELRKYVEQYIDEYDPVEMKSENESTDVESAREKRRREGRYRRLRREKINDIVQLLEKNPSYVEEQIQIAEERKLQEIERQKIFRELEDNRLRMEQDLLKRHMIQQLKLVQAEIARKKEIEERKKQLEERALQIKLITEQRQREEEERVRKEVEEAEQLKRVKEESDRKEARKKQLEVKRKSFKIERKKHEFILKRIISRCERRWKKEKIWAKKRAKKQKKLEEQRLLDERFENDRIEVNRRKQVEQRLLKEKQNRERQIQNEEDKRKQVELRVENKKKEYQKQRIEKQKQQDDLKNFILEQEQKLLEQKRLEHEKQQRRELKLKQRESETDEERYVRLEHKRIKKELEAKKQKEQEEEEYGWGIAWIIKWLWWGLSTEEKKQLDGYDDKFIDSVLRAKARALFGKQEQSETTDEPKEDILVQNEDQQIVSEKDIDEALIEDVIEMEEEIEEQVIPDRPLMDGHIFFREPPQLHHLFKNDIVRPYIEPVPWENLKPRYSDKSRQFEYDRSRYQYYMNSEEHKNLQYLLDHHSSKLKEIDLKELLEKVSRKLQTPKKKRTLTTILRRNVPKQSSPSVSSPVIHFSKPVHTPRALEQIPLVLKQLILGYLWVDLPGLFKRYTDCSIYNSSTSLLQSIVSKELFGYEKTSVRNKITGMRKLFLVFPSVRLSELKSAIVDRDTMRYSMDQVTQRVYSLLNIIPFHFHIECLDLRQIGKGEFYVVPIASRCRGLRRLFVDVDLTRARLSSDRLYAYSLGSSERFSPYALRSLLNNMSGTSLEVLEIEVFNFDKKNEQRHWLRSILCESPLVNLSRLEKFKINGSSYTLSDEDISEVFRIQYPSTNTGMWLTSLRHLTFENQTNLTVTALVNVIENMPALCSLSMKDCSMSIQTLREEKMLRRALRESSIHHLDLSGNTLNAPILKLLLFESQKLTVLKLKDMKNMYFSSDIFNGQKPCSTPKVLYLQDSFIDNNWIKQAKRFNIKVVI